MNKMKSTYTLGGGKYFIFWLLIMFALAFYGFMNLVIKLGGYLV